MREKFAEAGARFKGFWSSLKRWQQASLIGASVLVLGGILAVAMIAGRTAYSPVFSNLDPRDQDAVITFLKEEKIPYRTDPGANAILVPSANVYEARIALAGKGIPSGGIVGFEVFNDPKMGQTSFQEKINFYRALEGELTRTIMAVNGVESARVSIVVPEQKLFIEQQQPSTAAVLLKLRPGATFGQEQARSIVNLVAGSVEGLTAENVTLADADGLVSFSDILDDTLAIQNGKNLVMRGREFEKQQEREFELQIRRALEKPFGPGKVHASVRVVLDFDKRQSTQTVHTTLPDKQNGPIQSIQTTEESYEGPAGITGGIPGTTTNIPGYAVNTGQGSGNATYEQTNNVTNYIPLSTTDTQQVETPGKVRFLTATVLVDRSIDQAETEAWQAQWRDAVANAIGADEARGDRLSVMAVPFDTSAADAIAARLAEERMRRMIIGVSAFVLLLLAVIAGLVLWLRKRRRAMEEGRAADYQTPSLRELLENPDLMTSQGELSVLEEQLRNYAMNNPEELAGLIKNWVVEDI